MPFIGQDWRSPGTQWVKSEEFGGKWENSKLCRMRLFETLNEKTLKVFYMKIFELQDADTSNLHLSISVHKPQILFKLSITQQNLQTTSICDALFALDMKTSIKDMRRFNYVSKCLKILLNQHFHKLSGRAQMYIVELLKTITEEALTTGNQVKVIQELISDFNACLKDNRYNHIGGEPLWERHQEALVDLQNNYDFYRCNSRDSFRAKKSRNRNVGISLGSSNFDQSPVKNVSLERLPRECLDQIFIQLANPDDLKNLSLVSSRLSGLINDDTLWRRVVLHTFSYDQIKSVNFGKVNWTKTFDEKSEVPIDWKRAYTRLLKKYGDRHLYLAKIGLCQKCSNLFWNVIGHECTYTMTNQADSPIRSEEIPYRDLLPEDFINLFPL